MLERFDGTILLVSHDRYLIDRLATQIWELRDGRLEVFEGGYTEYVAARDGGRAQQPSRRPRSSALRRVAAPAPSGSAQNEARRRERALAEMEEQIHALESKLAQLERDLQTASHAQDLARLQELSDAYHQTQATLERSMEEWAGLAA